MHTVGPENNLYNTSKIEENASLTEKQLNQLADLSLIKKIQIKKKT